MTLTPEAAKTAVPETLTQEETIASLGRYGYGWSDSDVAGASAQRGLSEAVVRDISAKKNEPEWMLEHRLKALRIFERKPMPNWGSKVGIDATRKGPDEGHGRPWPPEIVMDEIVRRRVAERWKEFGL